MVVLTILFLTSIAILLHPRFRNWHKRNEPVFEFLVAVIATFCGVAWAIALGNAAEEKKERAAVANLLTAAADDATAYASNRAMKVCFREMLEHEERASGETHFQMSDRDSTDFLLRADRALLLDTVLGSDLVLRYISPRVLDRIQQERARQAAYAELRQDMDVGRTVYLIANLIRAESEFQRQRLNHLELDKAVAHADSIIGVADSVTGSWYGLLARVRQSMNDAGYAESWLRSRRESGESPK